MITMKEIELLNKDMIWDRLADLGLEADHTDPGKAKRDLKLWFQIQCEHTEKGPQYDMSNCVCPDCDVLLTYDFDTDQNTCENCDRQFLIEETGSMDNMETFTWLEECICCRICLFIGHPDESPENPFAEVEELPSW